MDRRGDYSTVTGRDPRTESKERMRRGGGGYDAGPGRSGMPSAGDMDRPQQPCGAFQRTGNSRRSIERMTPRIQDADRN